MGTSKKLVGGIHALIGRAAADAAEPLRWIFPERRCASAGRGLGRTLADLDAARPGPSGHLVGRVHLARRRRRCCAGASRGPSLDSQRSKPDHGA